MTIGIVDEPTAVPMTPMDIARLRISGLYLDLSESRKFIIISSNILGRFVSIQF